MPAATVAAPDALAEEVFRQPVQRVQIAQAALAVLDVGLDLVAALAGAAVALVALGHLGVDEARAPCPRRPRCGSAARSSAKSCASPWMRRASSSAVRIVMSAGAELDALVDGARRVPDLEAQIPQHIEHVLGDALAPRRLLVGQQEQQIDVGARRQQAAAVAAGRDDRHALGVRGIGRPVDVRDRVVVEQADELVLERREPGGAAPPVAVRLERPCAPPRAPSSTSAFRRSTTCGARLARRRRARGKPRSAPRAARADRNRERLICDCCIHAPNVGRACAAGYLRVPEFRVPARACPDAAL